MPPLPPSGERRQPRFTASRQPFTTVVRPCAARCCKTMPSRWRSGIIPPSPSGTSGWTHTPCGRLENVSSPFAQGSRFSTGRRAAVGFDSTNAFDADAHGSGLPSACAICRQWLRDSASAGTRTIAALRPSTRRAVLETLRSSTSRTRDNCAIVCVCAFIRCALCRPGSDAGGREIVHWVSGDDDMAAPTRRGTK